MTEQSAYDASTMPGGLDLELERLRQQALVMWDKEARTLGWFGLRDGMSILELGAGPGFITEQLLMLCPSSRITVVELDPVMIERSSQYLRGRADDRLRIIEGSVMAMDLPDNSFDFAYGRYLFQHLPDPRAAAREVLRVLKPGGRLVILDIDDKSHIIEPVGPPEVTAVIERFRAEHAAKGGNRYIGRRLPRIMREAGYRNLDLELLVGHSDIVGLEALGQVNMPDAWRHELEAGLITQEEFEAMVAFETKFYASNPLVMLVAYLACGEKP